MNTNRLSRHLSGWTNRLFYAVVLGIALTGSGLVAVKWLNWTPLSAFLAVGAVELGAVALSIHADRRRQLGERAVFARLLSAAVAVGGVAINYFGHRADHLGQAVFFAGMSALGYLVWLVDSGARRRDHLRQTGNLPPTAPAYGAVQWMRHPGLTHRARQLALRDPALGLYGSLAAAADEVRDERADAALTEAIRLKMMQDRDPLTAEIAVGTYQPAVILRELRRRANYDPVVGFFAAAIEMPSADGAAVSPAIEAPETAVVHAEIVDDAESISAVRQAAKHRLNDRDARRTIAAFAAAEPGTPATEIAHIATRSPRRVREIRAAIEKTGEVPAVKQPKSGGPKIGFGS